MKEDLVEEILESVNLHRSFNKNMPHLIINANEVLSSHQVEGLIMEPQELPDGVKRA